MTPPQTSSRVVSSSVFDRLYSKSTESQRMRKAIAPDGVIPQTTATRDGDKSDGSRKNLPKNRYKTAAKPKDVHSRTATSTAPAAAGGVYDRLYSKGTASCSAKRKVTTSEGEGNGSSTRRGPLKSKSNT